MAKQEQHLTTVRLSALIDGQLSPEEQRQSETHLQSCAVCQQQLAELRQTVALLHALPQPPLPRSFVLPTAEPALASPRVIHSARPLAPITPLPRRNGWPTYVTGAVRVASTLAALVGIVFLLSGLFGTVIPVGSSTASSGGTSTTSGNGPGKTTPQFITPRTTYKGITPTATSTKGQTVTSPKGHTTAMQQNPLQAFLDVRLIGIRAILGTILLVLGIIGFIVLARRV